MIVVQADELTVAGVPTVLVVPLTTRLRPELEPLRVAISARGRLTQDCHAMVEQVRVVDRRRLGEGPLTALTADELAGLERSLKAALGLL